MANASSITSYRFNDGALGVLAGPVATNQTAACWVFTTRSGSFAYTTNTGSDTVSSYKLHDHGKLTLRSATAGGTGHGPIDADMSTGSGYLYVLNAGGTISAFRVNANGGLTAVAGASGLPVGGVGMVAD